MCSGRPWQWAEPSTMTDSRGIIWSTYRTPKVASMPELWWTKQGYPSTSNASRYIHIKQQKLCGQRWCSVFDFATGFYAVEVHEDTKPYLTFYDECKGFLTYAWMPFGLTGAPTCFNDMTAREMGDLKDKLFQLFVNDSGMASDEFNQHITDFCTLLNRVRDRKLSLSTSKTELFMTEAVFARATVGPDGIKPDLTKLTAVIDWQQPTDLSSFKGFLGLTGHFRDLIQDYSRITSPLTDLKQQHNILNNMGKAAY